LYDLQLQELKKKSTFLSATHNTSKISKLFFQYHLTLMLLSQTVPQLSCINAQTQGTKCFAALTLQGKLS